MAGLKKIDFTASGDGRMVFRRWQDYGRMMAGRWQDDGRMVFG